MRGRSLPKEIEFSLLAEDNRQHNRVQIDHWYGGAERQRNLLPRI